MNLKVGIIVVNYNKKDLLRNCLNSVKKNNYAEFVVLVVDNGSNDGSIEMMKDEFEEMVLIEMGYNSGFCKANNAGIKKAFKLGCQAVVFLNNDTEVESDFLQEMVVAIDIEKKIEMIASKIIFFDNKSRMDSAGLLVTPDGLAKNRGLGQSANNFKESCEVFCPAGAAALFSRKLLEDIEFNGQYFDEDYGFYFEELDLGWRARLRGWNCIFAPKSVVYHLKSASAGEYSEFIAYYTNRNIFYNIIKNYPAEFFLKALVLSFLRFPFLFLGVLFGQGPGAKIRNKIGFWKMIKVTVKGFRDIILKSRKMIKKRKHIQKERIVEKRKIKKWFHDFGLSFLGSIYK